MNYVFGDKIEVNAEICLYLRPSTTKGYSHVLSKETYEPILVRDIDICDYEEQRHNNLNVGDIKGYLAATGLGDNVYVQVDLPDGYSYHLDPVPYMRNQFLAFQTVSGPLGYHDGEEI